MLTERDQRIIELLKEKEMNFIEIYKMFWSDKTEAAARKRLNQLSERGHIKKRKGVDDYYTVYYI